MAGFRYDSATLDVGMQIRVKWGVKELNGSLL
jgi:hypothetical protein